MKFVGRFDATQAIRASRALQHRVSLATAQELNRQRRRSRTLLTRNLSRILGVRPQRRIRKRILLPRAGQATRFNLRAWGLSLYEVMPARWFTEDGRTNIRRGGGITVSNTRSTRGKPFWATTKSGRRDIFRRAHPSRPRNRPGIDPQLPIQAMMMNTSIVGQRVRQFVLNKLAYEWPDIWTARIRREIRRTFRR